MLSLRGDRLDVTPPTRQLHGKTLLRDLSSVTNQ
jgi:hypothetical protein